MLVVWRNIEYENLIMIIIFYEQAGRKIKNRKA